MQRSENLYIDVENVELQCFIRCMKCKISFTDKIRAYAAYLCSHFFCKNCLQIECCPECCALLAQVEFRKIVSEPARLQIIKIFKIPDNYDTHPPEMVRRIKKSKPRYPTCLIFVPAT